MAEQQLAHEFRTRLGFKTIVLTKITSSFEGENMQN